MKVVVTERTQQPMPPIIKGLKRRMTPDKNIAIQRKNNWIDVRVIFTGRKVPDQKGKKKDHYGKCYPHVTDNVVCVGLNLLFPAFICYIKKLINKNRYSDQPHHIMTFVSEYMQQNKLQKTAEKNH